MSAPLASSSVHPQIPLLHNAAKGLVACRNHSELLSRELITTLALSAIMTVASAASLAIFPLPISLILGGTALVLLAFQVYTIYNRSLIREEAFQFAPSFIAILQGNYVAASEMIETLASSPLAKKHADGLGLLSPINAKNDSECGVDIAYFKLALNEKENFSRLKIQSISAFLLHVLIKNLRSLEQDRFKGDNSAKWNIQEWDKSGEATRKYLNAISFDLTKEEYKILKDLYDSKTLKVMCECAHKLSELQINDLQKSAFIQEPPAEQPST